jgi:hypothetical protein
MASNEYLEHLRKQLVGQADRYAVEGFYSYHGKQNDFTGLFDIDNQGKIAGSISDPDSLCKMHVVDGNVTRRNGFTRMKFVKVPTIYLVRVYYGLTKPGEELEGQYNGVWEFREEALDLKLNGLVKEIEIGNKAQIIMSKICQ